MSEPISNAVPILDDAAIAAVAKGSPVWLWVYEIAKQQYIYSNEQIIEELGYTPQQIRDMTDNLVVSIMHPDDIPDLESLVERSIVLKDGETEKYQLRLKLQSGEYHYFLLCVRVFTRDEHGVPKWVLGAGIDITEQLDVEEKYRFQSGILEQVSDAIVAIDRDSNVIYWNSTAEKLYGIDKNEIIGKPLTLAYTFDWNNKKDKLDAEKALKSVGVWHGRNTHVLANGERKYVEATISLLHDRQNRAMGTLASIRDITERRRLEYEVTQAQNLESLGLLAGGVSHEFNNILAAILGYAEVVHSRLSEDDPNKNLLSQIIRSGERGASLTQQLLAFARRGVVEMREINVNEVLRGSTLMLGTLLRTEVEIVLELQQDLWNVKADPAQLEQVLVNLALNAKDAMVTGGTLTIETKNCSVTRENTDVAIEMPSGEYVLISVTDTGHGMERTVKERAFEPFFTTKEIGKGTGLGLATSYGIIAQSDGFMFIDSEPGKGATFRIYLPRI